MGGQKVRALRTWEGSGQKGEEEGICNILHVNQRESLKGAKIERQSMWDLGEEGSK